MPEIVTRPCLQCDGTVRFDLTERSGLQRAPVRRLIASCSVCGIEHSLIPAGAGDELFWIERRRR